MPLARVLLVGLLALVLMAGVFWLFDVNYAAWLGVWLAPDRQLLIGSLLMLVIGMFMAWMYTNTVGSRIPGHGALRGLAFGAVMGAAAIWAAPPVLEGVLGAVGDTQTLYQGRGIHDDRARADEEMHTVRIEPCPPIAGMQPPLAQFGRDMAWVPASAWRGRLLPFGLAFLAWGLVLGLGLSEQVGPRKKD
jgi:hypothetical protein